MRSSRRSGPDPVRVRLGSVVRARPADPRGDRGPGPDFDTDPDFDTGRRFDTEAELDALVADTPNWLDDEPERESSRWTVERFRGARVDPGRRGPVVLGLIGVAVVVLACFVVFRDRPQSHAAPAVAAVSSVSTPTSAVDETPAELVVSVVGLVQVNGLVRLQPGARIADAIAAAGGPVEGADLLSLNMAQRVADGDQILVGVADPAGGPPVLASGTLAADGAAGAEAATGLVDLNSATEAELDTLPGVGPVTAAAIVEWRNTNGPFTAVEQLGEVDGIGPSRLARLRDLVTL